MLQVVVLISGGGSNLASLLATVQVGALPITVVAVGADREAPGLDHARRHGIPTFVVNYADYASREEWGEALSESLRQHSPHVVVLSGLMRLLPETLVTAWEGRIINTHPAFLPEFPGAHAVRDAIAAGVTQTGASVIKVDAGIDTGPILAQRRVAIHPGDTEATVHDRIKIVERELLVEVLEELAAAHSNS